MTQIQKYFLLSCLQFPSIMFSSSKNLEQFVQLSINSWIWIFHRKFKTKQHKENQKLIFGPGKMIVHLCEQVTARLNSWNSRNWKLCIFGGTDMFVSFGVYNFLYLLACITFTEDKVLTAVVAYSKAHFCFFLQIAK